MILTRRATLFTAAAGAASLALPHAAFAAQAGERRLVVILLRGGLDGLAAVAPLGDPAYANARRGLALEAPGKEKGALALDGFFALHPRLPTLHGLYRDKQLLVAHALASPYRERSHFDAQNVLETGAGRPFAQPNGWLNAALTALPQDKAKGRKELGLALANQAPLMMRGAAPVATWSPSPLPDADADTLNRLMDLYGRTDPALAKALAAAQDANAVAGAMDANARMGRRGGQLAPMAKIAANFLKDPAGPVAALLEVGGWDTHAAQGGELGALARGLAGLDEAVGVLRAELGPLWATTAVLVVTEFGRTVAVNGAGGTDHGTGAAAFLLGGAVRGGRVLTDWPGLAPAQLLDGRDLRPTTDVRALLKGVLGDHLGVASAAIDRTVLPDASAVRPIAGLIV